MTQKFRKGLFKVMPLSMAAFLFLALTIGTWQSMPVKNAQAAVPTFTASIKAKDGSTDKILLTFSEAVSRTSGGSGDSLEASDLTIAGTDALTISSISHVANSKYVLLTMSANINLAGAGELTVACAADSIFDNGLTNACVQGATDIDSASLDSTGPTVSAVLWLDGDADGDIERAEIQFNETIKDTTVTVAEFEFDNDTTNNATGEEVASSGGTGVTTIASENIVDDPYYSLNLTTGISGTEAANLHITGTTLTDLLGNAAVAADNVGVDTDGATPRLVSSRYQDLVADGAIDNIETTWSENVTMNGSTADDWTITGGSANVTFASAANDAVAGTTLNITVTADANETISGGTTINYDNNDANNSVTDGTNHAGNQSVSTSTDNAAPRIRSSNGRSTLDNNNDGTVDYIKLVFTESTEDGSIGAADFCVSTSSGACVEGDLVESFTSTVPASGNETDVGGDTKIYIGIANGTQTLTANKTDYTLAVQMVGSVNDSTGNFAVSEGSATNSADDAAPVIVSITTAETSLNGTVDQLTVAFSESVDIIDGAGAADGFTGFDGLTDSCTISNQDLTSNSVSSKAIIVSNCTAGTSITVELAYNTTDGDPGIFDEALVPNQMTNDETIVTGIDGAAPYLISATYSDTQTSGTGYGEVDKITLVFSEITTFTYNVTDWAFTETGDVTLAGDFAAEDCTGSGESTTIVCYDETNNSMTSATNKTGKQTDLGAEPVWAYTNSGGNRVTDGTNHTATVSKTLIDNATPMLVTSTPVTGTSGVSRTADLSLTFSEYMNTSLTEAAILSSDLSPTSGTFTYTWSGDDTILGINPSNFLNPSTSYTLTITDANSAVTTDYHVGTNSITFTSAASSGDTGGGGGATVSTTPVVTITNLADQTGGEVATITWTTSGSGIDTVGLYYSTNSGSSYNQIAYNVNKSEGEYDWTIPNEGAENVIVKIIAYDSGKANLDEDVSDAFSITKSVEVVIDLETPAIEDTTTDSEGRLIANDSGDTGPSPITGEDEAISTVVTGQYIRSYGFNTIYYIDENYERRPFWDTNSFFTYADSFDEIVWVTDATLPTMTLGAPMLPATGVVLVKIQSDPKVYAIDSGSVLRWVPDEDTAITLYGSAWADYVIDLEPTIFARFTTGDDMTTSDDVDTSIMKTRLELAELAQ